MCESYPAPRIPIYNMSVYKQLRHACRMKNEDMHISVLQSVYHILTETYRYIIRIKKHF